MKLFDTIKGYATPQNAEKKLRNEVGNNLEDMHWVIAINTEGRYVPIVTGWPSNPQGLCSLVHCGICVAS